VLVDDVVRGLILAMEKGRTGQKYIIGGENASLKEFFRAIDRVTGRRHFQIPMLRLAPIVFAHFEKWLADWFGVYPKVTPGWVRTFFANWPCSCEKAQRELGYQITPLEEGLRITCDWLQRVRNRKS
jgi:farnesol dehydrogenase